MSTTRPAAAQSDSADVRRWRADLALLRSEMPARHANLFHAITRPQFDSALDAIERRLPGLARHQVIAALMELDALVGDGHSSVGPWRDTATAFHELPISLYWFDDGIRVRAATSAHADLIGAKILRIGGVPVEQAVARIAPLVSRDNEMGLRMWAPVLMAMPEVLHATGLSADVARARFTMQTPTGDREVALEPAGLFPMLTGDIDLTWRARDGWVDARDTAPTPLWLSDLTNPYWFRVLPESRSLYIQLSTIQQKRDDSLATFFARALHSADSAGAERVILDLRRNGGGDGSHNRAIVRALVKSRYDTAGRLAVLTGRRTFSAAQMLLTELAKYTDATFVGEPSGSRPNHYGDSRRIVLPNSHVTVRVSSLYWQYGDPRDQRPWLPVQVPAALTLADYVAGRDPALTAAEGLSVSACTPPRCAPAGPSHRSP